MEKLLELFYEVGITSNPMCDNDIIRKTNYMLMSLMVIDPKTLSKTLIN